MKFQNIIRCVMFEPWLILARQHHAIQVLLKSKLSDTAAARPTEDLFGDKLQVMQITPDGMAIIPVKGVIGRGMGNFEKSCGAVDTLDIEEDLIRAAGDPRVRGILLDVDSPGGTIGGVPELADLISEISKRKTVYAWAEGLMASAAYWLAAGADKIYARATSEVGSIGVYIPWMDESVAYAQEGYEVKIIKNDGADYKAMGFPGTSLTKEQEELLKNQVNEIGDMFHGHVNATRDVDPEVFRAATYLGESAKRAGLVDRVVTSRADALEDLSSDS